MLSLYDVHAAKKATNLTINSDLLKKAKGLDINLSAALEHTLSGLLKKTQRQQWLVQNSEAIDFYNHYVEKRGCFSKGIRKF